MAERNPKGWVALGYRDNPRSDLRIIEHWLEGVTYRPGSSLRAHMVANSSIAVTMEILVFNSYGQAPAIERDLRMVIPGQEIGDAMRTYLGAMLGDVIKVTTTWVVPPYVPDLGTPHDAKVFRDWLRRCFHEWEAHESDEWFKDKATGRPFFDPHENGRTAL